MRRNDFKLDDIYGNYPSQNLMLKIKYSRNISVAANGCEQLQKHYQETPTAI